MTVKESLTLWFKHMGEVFKVPFLFWTTKFTLVGMCTFGMVCSLVWFMWKLFSFIVFRTIVVGIMFAASITLLIISSVLYALALITLKTSGANKKKRSDWLELTLEGYKSIQCYHWMDSALRPRESMVLPKRYTSYKRTDVSGTSAPDINNVPKNSY